MDDTIAIGDDQCEVNNLKGFLGNEFEIKDLVLRYFLGIEVARSKDGIFLSQCYALDLLQEYNVKV